MNKKIEKLKKKRKKKNKIPPPPPLPKHWKLLDKANTNINGGQLELKHGNNKIGKTKKYKKRMKTIPPPPPLANDVKVMLIESKTVDARVFLMASTNNDKKDKKKKSKKIKKKKRKKKIPPPPSLPFPDIPKPMMMARKSINIDGSVLPVGLKNDDNKQEYSMIAKMNKQKIDKESPTPSSSLKENTPVTTDDLDELDNEMSYFSLYALMSQMSLCSELAMD